MELRTVLDAIETTPKGANVILEWDRPAKTKKSFSGQIRKQVRMVGRVGINYDNMAAVKEKRENGELPAQNGGLPWGEWLEVKPNGYIITHKGKLYVRMYNGTSDKVHPSVQWIMNDEIVTFEDVEPFLLASEKRGEKGECFTCKLENITRIHRESDFVEDAIPVEVIENEETYVTA